MSNNKISNDISKAVVINLTLDESKIVRKVTNDNFGLFVAQSWYRLIDPFVPYKTGQLAGVTGATVDIQPWNIWYKMPYAAPVYYSNGWNFSKDMHKQATDHWDVKAAQAGQLDNLYITLNDALEKGIY